MSKRTFLYIRVSKLRLAEVDLSRGQSIEEVCKKLQISP
jgi:hypothetical protein